MTVVSAAALRARFEENDAPSSADFADVIGSFVHRASAAGTTVAVNSLGAGVVGRTVFFAGTTASAQSNIGIVPITSAAAVGQTIHDATTTASAKNNLGAGAVGTHLFEATTTASARRDLDLNIATTAQMSAPTNTSSAFVTPGLQHYHPLMPKAWVRFNGAGTVSIRQAWNVASISDIGTGLWRVNWGSAFSTDGYGVGITIKSPQATEGNIRYHDGIVATAAGNPATTDVQVECVSGGQGGGSIRTDSSAVTVWVFDR